MDSKELKGLIEAYSEVYAPQEEIDEGKSSRPRYPGGRGVLDQERRDEKRDAAAENMRGHTSGPGTMTKNPKKLRKQKAMGELGEAVKGADPEMRKAASAERRAGDKPLSKKVGDANAAHMARKIRFSDKISKAKRHIPGYTYSENVDTFDAVLEYLVAEGYADNNQEALYIMANLSEDEILEYRKLAAAAVGGLMALNMMKPGVAPTGIKRQAPEPDKTELVSKADKEKKDAEERRQADLYAQSRVDQARRTGLMK